MGVTRQSVRLCRNPYGLASLMLIVLVAALTTLCPKPVSGKSRSHNSAMKRVEVRLGYMPNVTHAQALIGVASGNFQRRLGVTGTVSPKVANAGPDLMEGLLAREIDIAYVGPSPAINTYLKSNGKALRIIAGACNGGAALVARGDRPIKSVRDLGGKRVAVPQLGGTQDVSCNHFIGLSGLKTTDKGGTVEVIPVKNPDILALFKTKQLDAAWVPEPWASRLVKEAGAKLVVDERDLWPAKRFSTTVIVARTEFLHDNPLQVEAILDGHVELTKWIKFHTAEAQTIVNNEIKRLMGKPLSADILKSAWGRVDFTNEPDNSSIVEFMKAAKDLGYIHEGGPNITGIFDAKPLKGAKIRAASKGH